MIRSALVLALGSLLSVGPGKPSPVPILKGLRLTGTTAADLPITSLTGDPMTVYFDIEADELPRIELRFFHCDRNWKVTETTFINDGFWNHTKTDLPFTDAPVGVRAYRYEYQLKVPSAPYFDGFPYSGNYKMEIWDVDNEALLGAARFFVAEQRLQPSLTVVNRRDPASVAPWNQVHHIKVRMEVPPPDSLEAVPSLGHDFTVVDVYRNREITRRWRIDVNDSDPATFVEGWGTNRMIFSIDNLVPGNEYRVIDLTNVTEYPGLETVRSKAGADLSRFPWQKGFDYGGSSKVVQGTRYADYLNVEFELLWDEVRDSVFVVGDFNGWDPVKGGPMTRNDGRYRWTTSLRRGRYDYQYVVGNDWVQLEGNDWKTSNRYTAIIYYRDQRFGGFDRILGVAR